MLNDSIRYEGDRLMIDSIPAAEIAREVGTPTYVYSLKRLLANMASVREAFAALDTHIHYSVKANNNPVLMRTLVEHGAGIDAVSGGEVYLALKAGARPEDIVFAGVGKTRTEIAYAVRQGIGWFNVENVAECRYIDDAAAHNGARVKVALRLNPGVTASTHPYIATGHGGAKFGLTAEVIRELLADQDAYPHLEFAGLHVHIGSQLHDTDATRSAIEAAVELITPYSSINTINIGGGMPVAYKPDDALPSYVQFAEALTPLLREHTVLLEPGRSLVADAGLLLTEVLYTKRQAGQVFYIVDASMTELMRPSLYQAHHEIVPLQQPQGDLHEAAAVVGPVCETADVLRREALLPVLEPGDHLAILTAGAYGQVMASTYNARPRPPEVVVQPDGATWDVSRPRETWADLV
jgi:diaminopimelate decarboxylase